MEVLFNRKKDIAFDFSKKGVFKPENLACSVAGSKF